MRPRDTSIEAQKLLDDHHRRSSPTEKAGLLRDAWRTARALQLAGLRARFPDESEEQLELRLAERWLGAELLQRALAQKRARGLE